jgi:long-chain fatty acid transport protein
MRKSTTLLSAAVMLWTSTALAGGFLIYEHGASGTGMASARTANADEPSSLFFNPAAITELPGFQFQVGATGILPYVSYEAAGSGSLREYVSTSGNVAVNDGVNDADAKIKFFNPIHLYATYNLESVGLSFGYALNNPFGLGSYWPGNWDGRFIATEAEIQTFFNQPTVAIDIAKLAGFKSKMKLSLGVAYNFVYGTARLSKKIDLRVTEPAFLGGIAGAEGEMRMTGSAIGHGWNVSLYAELPEWFSFGASARGGFKAGGKLGMPFSGNAKFVYNPAGEQARVALAAAGTVLPESESGGDITIDLPLNMNFGLAYLGVKNLKIEFDFFIAFFESYKELDLQFACVDEGTCSALEGQEPIAKNWKESMQFSLAAEYLLKDMIFLRAGYGLVTSPVPDEFYDPSLPDGRRDLICLGAGYKGSWWKIDLGYMLAMWQGKKSHLDGNYVGVGEALDGSSGVNPDGSFLSPMLGNPEGMAEGTYKTVTHLLALSFTGAF